LQIASKGGLSRKLRLGHRRILSSQAAQACFSLRAVNHIAHLEDIEFRRSARYSRVREERDEFGSLVFSSGMERTSTIEHLPVVDLRSGEIRKLSDFAQLFRDW
jgi:hypothetical protein